MRLEGVSEGEREVGLEGSVVLLMLAELRVSRVRARPRACTGARGGQRRATAQCPPGVSQWAWSGFLFLLFIFFCFLFGWAAGWMGYVLVVCSGKMKGNKGEGGGMVWKKGKGGSTTPPHHVSQSKPG